ncbi:MAG: peptidyl-prolyl cis-trans isomerase [Actinomycetota bacterium]|nr:peptidyl-prolyl cis-trans isomerase [Actinomycetota bacterium]
MLTPSKRTVALAFAGLLAVTIILVAATSGLGKPGVPDGAVAFVEEAPDGAITQEQFDAALTQAAARQGAAQGGEVTVPEVGTPQYDLLKETAMAELLLARWVRGEADELGIEVADREIDTELETIVEDQFGGQKEFDRFLEQSSFTPDDARERVELQLLSSRIQEEILGTEPPAIPDQEIQEFYDDNIEQFRTPETRDVRILLNPDEAKAQEAFDQLSEDDSPGTWKQTTQKLSTDEATAPVGGLRQGVVEGQNEPALDEAIFNASEGELLGPIAGEAGSYVVQVTAINPEETQELDDRTTDQIGQTLGAERQQEIATDYQDGFLEKWRTRSACSDEVAIDRCSNAPPPPDPCQGDDEGEEPAIDPITGEPTEGCPAFVPSTRPVPPSSAGETGAAGLPQGPQYPEPPEPADLPPGAEPIPGGGAPGQAPPPIPGG